MEPKIVTLQERQLVGMCITTTISFDDTKKMWGEFVSRQGEIHDKTAPEYYSIQVYPEGLKFKDFTEETKFERWAAVEVDDLDNVPAGMKSKILAGGLYATFTHKGPVKTFVETSNYIYGTWLPNSGYELDHRAHFEKLGKKYYGPDHPDSEEDLFVPIREITS